MAKGKSGKDEKAAKDDKSKDGKKDAKRTPRPAVAADRAGARTGGTLPGPPPPASEVVVPAARTAPDGAAEPTVTAPAPAPAAPAASAPTPAAPAAPAPVTSAPAASAPAASAPRPANGSGPVAAARRPAAPAAPGEAVAPAAPAASSERRPGLVDELTTLALMPVDVARRVLPERRLPFYLGVGALAVVGVVEWPVVLAAGMAWEALRRRRA